MDNYIDNFEDIGMEQLEDALIALERTLDSIINQDIADSIIDNLDRREF
jgi:hypothetical protein